MMKLLLKITLLTFLISGIVYADDVRERSVTASVIEDSMCISAIDGLGFLHVDKDVANLVIVVIGDDGQTIALYDDVTEIEDVAAPGTGAYSTPSANKVRVSPQGNTGGDCTEMQFANSVYTGQKWITITVSDGQATIMDFSRTVYITQPF